MRLDQKSLKILVTNHHLLNYRGSELFTINLVDYLISQNHEITVFTKYIDDLKDLFDKKSVTIVSNLEEISEEKFDIAHVHHNICALEVRFFFPNLPIVYMSHGVIPFLEQPPELDIGIERYLAVSEEVQENLQSFGIEKNKIEIFRNKIDSEFFKMQNKINETPQNALVISNKIDLDTETIIRDACSSLDINVEFIGQRFQNVSPEVVVEKINQSDIVFTLGRGVIETMMCGRIPIIYDVNGGDGIVLPERVSEYVRKNFSGRVNNKKFTSSELVQEIKMYDQNDGEKLRKIAFELFNYESFGRIIDIYKKVISKDLGVYCTDETLKILGSIVNISKETIHYEGLIHKKKLAKVEIDYVEYFITYGHLAKAKEILDKNDDIPNLLVKNNLAVIAIMEERHNEALEIIKEILRIDPLDEIALNNLKYLDNILNNKQINLSSKANENSVCS